MRAGLELRRYRHVHVAAIREVLLDVHDEVYAGVDDPLAPREAFSKFVDSWSSKDGFACVVGYDQGEPVGYAYGAPLSGATTWWERVTPPLPGMLASETGTRTFALSELMVRGPWRGTGASRQIHDELVRERPEERVTLLVHKDHLKVRALYERWGYRTVGETVPFEGAPELCAMLLDRRD
ncbi:GCN5-like N-acetyltransferase [Streptomyces zinciresistens K42]|uniref:GCN5-like N-acetyltransferase n=1 Tax=Streptomyces zinciresistens K42 TaxID=700597 RepID=G2GA63_9ACTN|nr:GNAT family N-acetyltransferase [Streptomyces zinciresistens]EGX59655.1 GCN5-like N-acetyltransferase [Streptomyces zinciresistens K42]